MGDSNPMCEVTIIRANVYRVCSSIKLFSQEITDISWYEPHHYYSYFTNEGMKALRGWWFAQGQ